MPSIVAHGLKHSVYACAYCHLPDGSGRPKNAPLAGFPPTYIERQLVALRNGTRRGDSSGEYLPAALMQTAAQHTTEVEVGERRPVEVALDHQRHEARD